MAPCQGQVEVWHEELKRCDNIDIDSHRQSLSLQVMIYTIEEGFSRGKIGGDGREGGEASAGSSERASAGLKRDACRALIRLHHQASGVAALSITTCEVQRPFGREIDLKGDTRRGKYLIASLSTILATTSRYGWVRGKSLRRRDAARVARDLINTSLVGLIK